MSWSLFNLITIYFKWLGFGMQKHNKSISQVSLRVIFILYISSEAERELCVRKMQSFVLGISYFWIILLSQISMKWFTELVWCYIYNSIHYTSLLLTLFLLLIRGNNYREIYRGRSFYFFLKYLKKKYECIHEINSYLKKSCSRGQPADSEIKKCLLITCFNRNKDFLTISFLGALNNKFSHPNFWLRIIDK